MRCPIRLSPLVEASLLPVLPVSLGQPLAGLPELHAVDVLLEEHDGCADDSERPRKAAIHLVGAGHLHSGGGEGRGEEHRGFGLGGRARVEGQRLGNVAVGGKEGGRDNGRREAEEIESDEEELVESAGDEEDPLLRFKVSFVNLLPK